MKPEQGLWNKLRNHMKGSSWDATRHEDSCTAGTPDVSWGARNVNGWLELKVIDHLPKNPKDPVKIQLRPSQRIFLIKRSRAGGHCSVLLWIAKRGECLLFTQEGAFRALETLNTDQLYRAASMITEDLPDPTQLLDVLTSIYRYGEI